MKKKLTQTCISMYENKKSGISSDFNKKKLPQKRMFILMMFLLLVTMLVTENSAMGQTTMLNNISFTENHRASSAAEPGNAIDFDGSDDYLLISDNDDAISTVFTLETWVKWEPAASNDVEFICGKDVEQMELHTGASANSLRFIPTTGVYLDAFGVLPTNAWTHIAAVYDAANAKAKMYINGEEVVLHSSGNPIGTALKSTAGPFNIGRRGNGTFYFNGAMDEFRIWNRERTQAEIQQDMDSAIISASQTGLVNYYAFNYGIAAATNTGLDSVIDLNASNNAYLFNFLLDGNTSNWVESYAMVFPIAMTATQVTDSRFIANWSIPILGFVNEYHLELATDSMFTNLVDGYSPKIISSSETSAIVNGLTGITDYYYRVKANKNTVNGQGCFLNSIHVKTTGFHLNPNLVSIADTANSTGTFIFEGDVTWTAINNNSWLNLNITSGYGDTTIIVTAQENPYTTARTGIIKFSSVGFADQYVTIIQAAKFKEPHNALNFDGIDDKVSMPYSDLNSLYPYSIEMWIRWMPDSINCTQYICEHGNERLQVKIVNGKLCFTPNPGMYFNTDVEIPVGVWTHIAISTCSCSADSRLYINGIEIPLPPLSIASYMLFYEPFLIGSGRYGAYPFKGSIDEFRIFNYQLSQAEVLANMNCPINPSTPGLIHYFKFNEGTAGGNNEEIMTAPDLVGAAHGTLQGFNLTGNASNWVESYAMVVPEATTPSQISSTSFTANWNAPITGERNNYGLEISDTVNFYTQIADSPFLMDSISNNKVVSGVVSGKNYYYRIKANKNSVTGQGCYSKIIAVTTSDSIQINAVIDPVNSGYVSGTGKYLPGDTITLTANANTGYTFHHWTESGTTISTNPVYSFVATSNRTLTADFNINIYHVSTSEHPTNSGSTWGDGDYLHGDTVILIATPYMGYVFEKWTDNGIQVSTDSVYSFVITENKNLIAWFVLKSFIINASVNPVNSGNVTGTGNYEHGENVTLTAIANTGYTFMNWTENGTTVSIDTSYSFIATANRTLVANFELNTYTIAASVNPVNSGNIAGTGNYEHGENVTLIAIANTDYTFINWTENGTPISIDTSYSFTATANRNLIANFELNTYTIAASVNPVNSGNVTGTGNYEHGENVTLTAIANTGYTFVNWTENGIPVSTDTSYSFTATSNKTLVANFELKTYTIAASVNPINSGNVTGTGNYEHGENVTLTAIANTGYTFVNWTESGIPVSTDTLFGFTANANRILVANFVSNQSPVAGTLTFSTTDLGIQTRTATNNIYDLGDIASTDNLTGLAIEIIDDNINTANIDVIYNGNVQGQMVYAGSNNLWVFSPSAPFNWNVGVNTLTTQFSDNDGNTLDITVNFTYVQMYRLNFAVINGHGALTAWDGNIQLVSPDTLEIGTAISFEAMPDSGYQVKEWKINGNVVSGNTSNSLEISSLSENTVVNVEFEFAVLVDELNLKNIQVFPNPTNSIININLSTIALSRGETLKINNMVLTDLTGKIILIQSIKTSHNHYNMNLSSLQNGIYFLKMETENEVLIEKIIKK